MTREYDLTACTVRRARTHTLIYDIISRELTMDMLTMTLQSMQLDREGHE